MTDSKDAADELHKSIDFLDLKLDTIEQFMVPGIRPNKKQIRSLIELSRRATRAFYQHQAALQIEKGLSKHLDECICGYRGFPTEVEDHIQYSTTFDHKKAKKRG